MRKFVFTAVAVAGFGAGFGAASLTTSAHATPLAPAVRTVSLTPPGVPAGHAWSDFYSCTPSGCNDQLQP